MTSVMNILNFKFQLSLPYFYYISLYYNKSVITSYCIISFVFTPLWLWALEALPLYDIEKALEKSIKSIGILVGSKT